MARFGTPSPIKRAGSSNWYYRAVIPADLRKCLKGLSKADWPKGWGEKEIWRRLGRHYRRWGRAILHRLPLRCSAIAWSRIMIAILSPNGMRMGALQRLFAWTVVVVEEPASIVNGENAELGDLLRFIRRESAALWAYGIDGDPAFRE